MRIDRAILIKHILKHRKAFEALLDYTTLKGGAGEIPQGLYIQQYRDVILVEGDDMDRRLLAMETLHENGLFVHLDKQADTLTMQSFLVEMLRFIDTSRIRELSHYDFENIRGQFQDICQRFESDLSITPGDKDYEEAKVTLFELVDNTLSKIQQNVEALDSKANSIGARYDKLDKEGHTTPDTRRLLEDSVALYERFIKPCHEFLSPSIGMKEGKKTFTASMERLASVHMNRGHPDIGLRIQYKMTAIRSYYKNIARIENRVQRYHRSLAIERLRYAAIETAYNDLLNDVIKLRHGKLKGTKLPTNSAIFISRGYLTGFKRHNAAQEQRIDWYDHDNAAILNEWVESIQSDDQNHDQRKPEPLPSLRDMNKERREWIIKLCISREWPSETKDIVQDIDSWLPLAVSDYTLLDFLAAYQCCMSLERLKKTFQFTRERKRIERGRYYFEYLVTRLGKPAQVASTHKSK